ncbi:MAG: Zn-ribbon domain-containing OB-fold protein [Actinomycetota bacterium]
MRPLPEPDDQSAPFWDAAARGRLVIQACAACTAVRHPPQPMCPRCRSFDTGWVQASGRGRVWSWIVCHPPVLPAFEDKVPYNVVVVELEEGVRMIGNLLDVPNDEIEEGLDVVVEFEDAGEGVVLPQWKRA